MTSFSSTGDAWIASWVPTLLEAMAGKRALLIILFDENRDYTNPNLVCASFSGTAAKNGVKSSNPYSHYSLLKLIETVWGGGSLGQGDVAAPSPTEFLR